MLFQEGLRALQKELGPGAGPAVSMASGLFCLIDQQDDLRNAQRVLDDHLLWLKGMPPDSLEPECRTVRESVEALFWTRKP
ncbi:hypothetical protein HI113_34995 [Corallococcus exiguus]|uniref:hypothetical protein n=1 Tax=Corallococcus exiguus TaxID=83462 RepID=UPI001472DB81|nr:hypothetical protein [Corallococcus exiguus]NNB99113.1 hypothetical protein [Corallococcus exiguus]